MHRLRDRHRDGVEAQGRPVSAPAVERPAVITEPGLYDGMSDDVYHGDPVPAGSLSSSGARRILPPKTPAHFAYERANGRAPKPVFDLGHAAHRLVLGVGMDFEVVEADDWRTKAAREQRDSAYTAGKVPLLAADHQRVQAMAAALKRHRLAAALLDPATGVAEQSAFWADPETGVWRRARFDFLRNRATGPTLIVDYKTAESADPEQFRRSAAKFGYHMQDPWYVDAATGLGLADDPEFLFVVQEKNPPYLVSVVRLDQEARAAGRERNRSAIDVFARCTQSGQWPGYGDEINTVSLPPYALRTEEITR
jgi:hypothetical protein